MSVRIDVARPEDIATVFALIRSLAEYERLDHLVVGTEDELRSELFGARPVIEAVLAWDDDTVRPAPNASNEPMTSRPASAVGFALFFHNYSTFLARRGIYLEDLYVIPEARGRGVGRALIAHCARLAVARGCGRFEWAVLDWNTPAIAFYRALGAEVLPDWRICRLSGEPLQRFAGTTAAAP